MTQIIKELTKLDPGWSLACIPWGDAIICHLTVNRITRSSVGMLGDTEVEKYEDALRNAARMFGVGTEEAA